MADAEVVAELALVLAHHHLGRDVPRLRQAAGSDLEVIREAAEPVRREPQREGAGTATHLAFTLLSATERAITDDIPRSR